MIFRLTVYKFFLFCLLSILFSLQLMGCNPIITETSKKVVRVGYFPNITHSQALIGIARGDFQDELGTKVEIQPTVFNAGPSEIEALFAGQIDIGYIGPNPAVNGYIKSGGKALRVIAGATSGGAAFVVRSAAQISKPEDLDGKKIATPQLGNTQDVALRAYLIRHGLNSTEKGGTVQIIPAENPLILDLLRQDQIDGAWVPEPWASRLILEGGARLFFDEKDFWPNGQFVTANIIVSTSFLENNPDIVYSWVKAHVEITIWEQKYPQDAMGLVNEEIKRITGKALSDDVLQMAWSRMNVTYDPICYSLFQSAMDAFQAGFLSIKPDLGNIYNLSILNSILEDKGLPLIGIMEQP